MPENANPTPVSTPTPASQGQSPQPTPAFTMPEKFSGKSAEDIARSYIELERAHGEQSNKVRDLEGYSKIGSVDQVNEAINWAKQVAARIQKGELIERGSQPTPKAAPAESDSPPWESEDWAFKSPAEQFKAFSEYQRKDARGYIDGIAGQYGQQIQGLAGRDAREKAILLRAVKAAIQNPGIDPEQILNEAGNLAGKSAEELIDMYLDSRNNSPEIRQKQIQDEVAKAVAEARQKWESEQQSEIWRQASPPTSRLRAVNSKTRDDEFREISQNLAKKGIRFS